MYLFFPVFFLGIPGQCSGIDLYWFKFHTFPPIFHTDSPTPLLIELHLLLTWRKFPGPAHTSGHNWYPEIVFIGLRQLSKQNGCLLPRESGLKIGH